MKKTHLFELRLRVPEVNCNDGIESILQLTLRQATKINQKLSDRGNLYYWTRPKYLDINETKT